ncbi:MAG: tRNA 2-thiouridine(34) synthase MnmA [Dehalococcoidales bacterium]|nr:tRNA 2-thiouridine(34) synthase MnmA [Dehalococcoidales bacterium]
MRIVTAMSGGVDSSVATALLKQEGHDVIGLTMQLWPQADEKTGGCCGIDAIEDARRVAYKLGIPHYVTDLRDIFSAEIISDFCREYGRGRTPNPCVLCNNRIKFGALLDKARELDADFIATGHYARLERDAASGAMLLKKGIDATKDQSYFLCRLTREQLEHALFPVGHLTKRQARDIAAELELPVADRPESQEICFIPDDDYAGFLARYSGGTAVPGPILDGEGRILGEHRGITAYTVGQRRGLGIAAPNPLYVTAIDAARNAVIVGDKEQTYGTELVAGELNWLLPDEPAFPLAAEAKVRYRAAAADATVENIDSSNVYVKFNKPQMAITPGQTIAFYHGDTVIGGGIIEKQGR